MAKLKKIDKPFADGTMTNAEFFSMIRSALRTRSLYWKPRSMAKQKVKRIYKGPNKLQKYEYQCNCCKKWFKDKEVNVDHIIPAGILRSFEDLTSFITNLFCDSLYLQVLCKTCHNKKTQEERAEQRIKTKLLKTKK